MRLFNDETYVATGGKPFDAELPTVVFLHGSGLDHRSWALQTRWFAFHGYSVLAPDFPGHSLSSGAPLESIEEMAAWVWRLCDEVGAKKVALVGHSQGALVALQAAADAPDRVACVSVIASAAAIPVNAQLLDMAQNKPSSAVDAMLAWGFGSRYRFGVSDVPGQAPMAIGSRIMNANPLAVDLAACQAYEGGADAAAKIQMPAQMLLAKHDKMTPLKAGMALADTLCNVQQTDIIDAGHMLPIEAPRATLQSLKSFISEFHHAN